MVVSILLTACAHAPRSIPPESASSSTTTATVVPETNTSPAASSPIAPTLSPSSVVTQTSVAALPQVTTEPTEEKSLSLEASSDAETQRALTLSVNQKQLSLLEALMQQSGITGRYPVRIVTGLVMAWDTSEDNPTSTRIYYVQKVNDESSGAYVDSLIQVNIAEIIEQYPELTLVRKVEFSPNLSAIHPKGSIVANAFGGQKFWDVHYDIASGAISREEAPVPSSTVVIRLRATMPPPKPTATSQPLQSSTPLITQEATPEAVPTESVPFMTTERPGVFPSIDINNRADANSPMFAWGNGFAQLSGVIVWDRDLETGGMHLTELKEDFSPLERYIKSVSQTPNGDVTVVFTDGSAALLSGKLGSINANVFLLTTMRSTYDGTVHPANIFTGLQQLSLAALHPGDYLAVTPDGGAVLLAASNP